MFAGYIPKLITLAVVSVAGLYKRDFLYDVLLKQGKERAKQMEIKKKQKKKSRN